MNSKVTYRQQFTRCGKQRCRKCKEGAGHGPYWYAYWNENGRTVSKYVGIRLPAEAELAQRAHAEQEKRAQAEGNAPSTGFVLRIYVLGQFRVERYQEGVWQSVDSRTWQRRRARALLGCLLSATGRRESRERVMDLLWPDLELSVAANRLNGAVHELRHILEPNLARPANSRMLRLERDSLELADSSQIWVDAEAFEEFLQEARTSTEPEQTERLLEAAASLYQGSYLMEELYSEWAASRRDALQQRWIEMLLTLADLRARRGANLSAIEALDRVRSVDATNETALQRLMILLSKLDRRGEALHIYQHYVSLLQRDYEGEPLPETRTLYEALLRGHIPEEYGEVRETRAPRQRSTNNEHREQVAQTPLDRSSGEPAAVHSGRGLARPPFHLGRHNQSPLIGRDTELATLRHVLLSVEASAETQAMGKSLQERHPQQLSSGSAKQPHFLLLMGEPGIGKTRLAEELSLEAYERGWAIAWSRSYEQESLVSYRSWTEALRALLQEPASVAELLGQSDVTSTNAAPTQFLRFTSLNVLLPELTFPTSPLPKGTPVPFSHESEQLHLWEATRMLLEELSQTHPLLFVFDDLHWADENSIALLTYLARHMQHRRVLLLATCRDGELAPLHKLQTVITDLRREQDVVLLSVPPLSPAQIAALVAHLPREMIESIQTQAAGNPFFAEELARHSETLSRVDDTLKDTTLVSQGEEEALPHFSGTVSALPGESRARNTHLLPSAIAAVLERRLGKLSSACQMLLSKATILGGSFELRQLLPLAQEHTEDTIFDLLEEALHAGLLTEEGQGIHITYHFWHPLVIRHLSDRLSAARRAQLQRRVAQAGQAPLASAPPEQA